jgi:hypothetical protein
MYKKFTERDAKKFFGTKCIGFYKGVIAIF